MSGPNAPPARSRLDPDNGNTASPSWLERPGWAPEEREITALVRRTTRLPTLGYALVGDILLYRGRGGTPSEADWDAWLDRVAVPDFAKLLVFTTGDVPSAGQRARLADRWKRVSRPNPRLAIVTDSAIVRAVAGAIYWIMGGTGPRFFAPAEITDAVAWLGGQSVASEVESLLSALG
jgi:hypothetical protein